MTMLRKVRAMELWLTTRSTRIRVMAGVVAIVCLGLYVWMMASWLSAGVTIEASGYVIDSPDVQGQEYIDNTIILEE